MIDYEFLTSDEVKNSTTTPFKMRGIVESESEVQYEYPFPDDDDSWIKKLCVLAVCYSKRLITHIFKTGF